MEQSYENSLQGNQEKWKLALQEQAAEAKAELKKAEEASGQERAEMEQILRARETMLGELGGEGCNSAALSQLSSATGSNTITRMDFFLSHPKSNVFC